MQPQRSTLERIAELEQIRIDLLNDTVDLASFHNETRLARLAAIRTDLDQLWAIERQHRALKRSQQSKSGNH